MAEYRISNNRLQNSPAVTVASNGSLVTYGGTNGTSLRVYPNISPQPERSAAQALDVLYAVSQESCADCFKQSSVTETTCGYDDLSIQSFLIP